MSAVAPLWGEAAYGMDLGCILQRYGAGLLAVVLHSCSGVKLLVGALQACSWAHEQWGRRYAARTVQGMGLRRGAAMTF